MNQTTFEGGKEHLTGGCSMLFSSLLSRFLPVYAFDIVYNLHSLSPQDHACLLQVHELRYDNRLLIKRVYTLSSNTTKVLHFAHLSTTFDHCQPIPSNSANCTFDLMTFNHCHNHDQILTRYTWGKMNANTRREHYLMSLEISKTFSNGLFHRNHITLHSPILLMQHKKTDIISHRQDTK